MRQLLLLVGLLAGVQASAREVSASARELRRFSFRTVGPLPFSNTYEDGFGELLLDAVDRVPDESARAGDEGRLTARFSDGGDSYVVELNSVGFRDAALAPPLAVGGGVVVDRDLPRSTLRGYLTSAHARAAFAIWGVGKVTKNGNLLTDKALIHALALSRGAYADDDTHRLLPEARALDSEVHVIAENLPLTQEPAGYLQFSFDDVRINVGGSEVAYAPTVPSVPERRPEEVAQAPGAPGVGGAPGSQQFGAAAAGGQYATPAPYVSSGVLTAAQQAQTFGRATDLANAGAGTGGSGTAGAGAATTSSNATVPGTTGDITGGGTTAPSAATPTTSIGAYGGAGTTPSTPSTAGGALAAPTTSTGGTTVTTPVGTPGAATGPDGLADTGPYGGTTGPTSVMTGIPATPAPLNAAPAVPLPQTPAPINASPAPAPAVPSSGNPAAVGTPPASVPAGSVPGAGIGPGATGISGPASGGASSTGF